MAETTPEEVLKRRRVEEKDVPGLGIRVLVSRVKAKDFIAISLLPKERQYFALVAACVLDLGGRPVYATVQEVEDAEWESIAPLIDLARQVNGMKEGDAEKK